MRSTASPRRRDFRRGCVDRGDHVELAKAYGHTHRGHHVAKAIDNTWFAIASGTEGFTALAVINLIEEGRLDPATPARSGMSPSMPPLPRAHLPAEAAGALLKALEDQARWTAVSRRFRTHVGPCQAVTGSPLR
jgi:hypothetical protein